jgi:hypothetical protein
MCPSEGVSWILSCHLWMGKPPHYVKVNQLRAVGALVIYGTKPCHPGPLIANEVCWHWEDFLPRRVDSPPLSTEWRRLLLQNDED